MTWNEIAGHAHERSGNAVLTADAACDAVPDAVRADVLTALAQIDSAVARLLADAVMSRSAADLWRVADLAREAAAPRDDRPTLFAKRAVPRVN